MNQPHMVFQVVDHMGFFICIYVSARYMCLLSIFALSLRAMTVVIGPGVYVTDNLVDKYVHKSTPEPYGLTSGRRAGRMMLYV